MVTDGTGPCMMLVTNLRFLKPTQFFAILVTIALNLCCVACPLDDSNPQRISELKQIAAEVPIHPSFLEVSSSEDGKSTSAGVSHFYRSSADYDEVKNFYIKVLLARGWGYPKEEPINKWFIQDGSKALTFRKGDYAIEVEYNNDSESRWRYSVDFRWKAP